MLREVRTRSCCRRWRRSVAGPVAGLCLATMALATSPAAAQSPDSSARPATASVRPSDRAPTLSPNQPDTVNPSPRLILRTVAVPNAAPRNAIRYIIQLANPDERPANDVTVAFDLPPGTRFISATRGGHATGNTITWPAITALQPGRLVSFSLEIEEARVTDLAPSATASFVHDANTDGQARVFAQETGRIIAQTAPLRPTTAMATPVRPQATAPPGDRADLEIQKIGPATANSGDIIAYQIQLTNHGPGAAGQVVVTDQLPAGTQFVDASDGGVEAGGTVSWPVLAEFGVQSVTYTLRVRAPTCPATIQNAARIASATADPDLTNNTSTVTTVVTGPACVNADVAVEKTGPPTAATDATVEYTIRATNRGPDVANGVVLTDELPAQLTFLDATGGITPVAGVLTWPEVNGLGVGESIEFAVFARAPSCPDLVTNTARVSSVGDPVAANDVASVTTVVTGAECDPTADVAILKTGPATALPGDTITYSITVWNVGPDSAIDVVVADTMPLAGRFVSASAGGVLQSGVVTWPARALAATDTMRLELRFAVPACSAITNFASVATASMDPDPSNDFSSVTTIVQSGSPCRGADVKIEKFGPGAVDPGAEVLWTLQVSNSGPLAALGVVVTDSLPEGLEFVSATGGATRSGNVLTWPRINRLGTEDTLRFRVTQIMPTDSIAPSYLNVGRVFSTAPPDPNVINNRSEATVRVIVVNEPDLDVTKEAVDQFLAGRTGRYRFTVRNVGNGPTVAPIVLTDTLPAGLSYQSGGGSGWTVSSSNGVVTGTFPGTLVPGASTSLEIVVSLADTSTGEQCNVVWIETARDTINVSNNSAETCVSVPLPGEIGLEKAADRSEVEVGGLVGYTLITVVTGSLPVRQARIEDRLPAGFSYEAGSARIDGRAVADPAGGDGRDLVFELGTIAPPDTVVVTYMARAGPAAVGGDGINRARAYHDGGSSDEVEARVRVAAGVFSDEGMIVGTVYADSLDRSSGRSGECLCLESDAVQRGEPGIPGVRVLLQDGTSAITDSHGRYLFPALSPRTWVVKVDGSTLPRGVRMVRLSNRHAGDGSTVLVDLKKGELHRADFAAVWAGPAMREELTRRRALLDSLGVGSPAVGGSLDLLRSGLDPPGRGTGLAPGIPWTRYVPLLPAAWTGPAMPDQGPLSGLQGFPRTPAATGLGAQADQASRTATPTAGPGAASGVTAGPLAARRQQQDSLTSPVIAIGLIEARLDARSLSDAEIGDIGRDAFEDALRSVSFDDDDGRIHGGTRAALFYRGRAAGRYGLTLRLDSEEDERAVLFRDIRPDDFYQIYGDGSASAFDARSRGRVFARIEADDSYLTWGDFNTGRAPVGTAGTRSLGDYARTLNGALQHYESDRIAFDAFASRDRSVQVIDVVRAEGVSGPYPLSRTDGLVNSERVELVTRHRDQPAVVLRTEVLERFVDYTIEPLAGRILFRRPIPGFDEDLNPVEIRVTYEIEGDGDRFWVYGANARFRPASALEIGGSLVRDDNPLSRLNLASVNATVQLPAATFLTGEYARTESAGTLTGNATRLEILHASDRFQLRGFWVSTDSTFRNPTASFASGRTELGLLASVRIADRTHVFTEILRSADEQATVRREGARIGLDRAFSSWLSGQVGFRYASTQVTRQAGGSDPPVAETNAVGVRLVARPGSGRGSVFAEFEQDVNEAEQRRAAVGADYRVLDNVRLYARHEFINSLTGPWNLDAGVDRNATVIGVATQNGTGRTLFSEYRVREAIDGREAQAAIGLRNAWRVGDGVRLSASLERLTPIGAGSIDATAVTGAAEFTGSPWWKGSIRTEYQARSGADNLFGSAGYARRLSPAFSLLGSSVFSTLINGDRAWARSRLGIAYRQVDANRWNALARYEHRYDRSAGTASDAVRTTTSHILAAHLDFHPIAGTLIRGQWTSRFTSERQSGISTNGSAHLLGGRGTVDLGGRFDVGVTGRTLFSGAGGTRLGFGGEVGVRLPADLRLAAGYNVFGFRGAVASRDEYTDRGAYVQLAFRFDEGLWSSDGPVAGRAEDDCLCVVRSDPDSVDLGLVIINPTAVLAGEVFEVKLETRNEGNRRADSVAVSASLLAGGVFTPAVPGPRADDVAEHTTGIWPVLDSLGGGQRHFEYPHIIAPQLPAGADTGSIVLHAAVDTVPGEFDRTNNAGTRTIRVVPRDTMPCDSACADLFVWISGPNRVVGDWLELFVWTKNIGAESADRVKTTVWFPDLEVLDQDGDQGLGRTERTFAMATPLGPNSSKPWPLRLRIPRQSLTLAVIARSTTVTGETNYLNNEANWVLHTGRSGADIGLRIEGPDSAMMGETVQYRISTDNVGGVDLGRVMLSGTIPSPSTFVTATGSVRADSLDWVIPGIDIGRSHPETLELVCSVPMLEVSAVAAPMDPLPISARAATSTICKPIVGDRSELRTRITRVGSGLIHPSGRVAYTITVTNDGPAPARLVQTTAEVRGGARVVSGSHSGSQSGNEISWLSAADLPPRDSLSYTLAVDAPPRISAIGPDVVIAVSAETATPEANPTDNDSDITTPVVPRPDLGPNPDPVGPMPRRLVKVIQIGPVGMTDLLIEIDTISVIRHTVRYRITTRNHGRLQAANVNVGATWPVRAAFLSATPGWRMDGDSIWFPTVPMLARGASVEHELELVMPAAPDTVGIDAIVRKDVNELDTTNNTDRTTAAMIIQDVVIPDTVIIRPPVPPSPWDWLFWPLVILLLVLLAIAIVLTIVRFVWTGPGGHGGPLPVAPPTPPAPPGPVPPLPGLPAACGSIEVNGTRGTAYLVRPDRLVTCSHVVSNNQRGDHVSIRLGDRMVHAVIHAVDPDTDIAILRPTPPITDVKPLDLAPEGPSPEPWKGFGYPGGPSIPGMDLGGVVLQSAASDRFASPTMTLTGPGLAKILADPAKGLRGSPVVVAGRVIGHLRGHVPHPDTLARGFADLIKAAPASRIIELLNGDSPDPASGTTAERPPAEPPERPEPDWSIAPELECCDDSAQHATVLHAAADADFARRLAGRLEGAGFKIRLHEGAEDQVPHKGQNGAGRILVAFSQAWLDRRSDDVSPGPSLPESSVAPLIVRVDDTPVPAPLESLASVDFCGKSPDLGPAFRELQSHLIGQTDPERGPLIEALIDATESAIKIVQSAAGRPKRTCFALKRWREAGLPGHAPDLIAAEQLLEIGHAEQALEILETLPAGPRAHQLLARAMSALGRIDDAIEKLESLRWAGHVDSETCAPLADLYLKKWTDGGRRRVAYIKKAFDVSSELYNRVRHPRAGMDAARFAVLAGDVDEARLIASEARTALTASDGYGKDDYGALGLACLLLGDNAAAFDALERAVAAAPDALESITALHRKVRDILDHLAGSGPLGEETDTRLAAIFYLPRVATIFAGDEKIAAGSAADLQTELRAITADRDIGLGVCCPDTLPSLVFAEEVLRRGGTIHAVLPVPREVFLAMRLAPSGAQRVDAVLSHERTTVSTAVPAAESVNGTAAAEAGPTSAGASDAQLVDALLATAARLASERVQRLLVLQPPPSDDTAPPDYLLDPAHSGPEFVALQSLQQSEATPAGARSDVATTPADSAAGPPVGTATVSTVSPDARETPQVGVAPDTELTGDQAAEQPAAAGMRDIMGIRRAQPEPPETGKYRKLHCVAIGIDEYTQWNPLKNAVNDATGVAKLLETEFGFNTRHLFNAEATRDRIRGLIMDTLPKEIEQDDLLILFFAGHGHTERLADDEEHGFLVPVDARKDSIADLLQMEEVVAWTEHVACDHVLYIFDSCFSGFAAMAGGVTKRGDTDDARVAISAGSAEQPVLDGGAPGGFEDHSIFTAHLLLRLTEAVKSAEADDDQVDSMRLYVDLRDKVTRATKRQQTPVYGFLSGHGAGEVWLTVRKSKGT